MKRRITIVALVTLLLELADVDVFLPRDLFASPTHVDVLSQPNHRHKPSLLVQAFQHQHLSPNFIRHRHHLVLSKDRPTTHTRYSASDDSKNHGQSGRQGGNNNTNGANSHSATTNSKLPPPDITINWHPSKILLNEVSYSYPDTNSIWRRLTSSVPRRDLAIDNLSLNLGPKEFRLIVGASSSGKSTLLKLILGSAGATGSGSEQKNKDNINGGIQPDVGIVQLLSCDNGGSIDGDSHASLESVSVPYPIVLDEKPSPYDYPRNKSLRQILLDAIKDNLKFNDDSMTTQVNFDQDKIISIQSLILEDIIDIFELSSSSSAIIDKSIDQLSQSENYLVAITVATIQSSLGNIVQQHTYEHEDDSKAKQQQLQRCPRSSLVLGIPAPIILLDEWMDTETSIVIRNVQKTCLLPLVQRTGGTILSVTHKPQLYSSTAAGDDDDSTLIPRPLTLCRGSILASC